MGWWPGVTRRMPICEPADWGRITWVDNVIGPMMVMGCETKEGLAGDCEPKSCTR